MGEDEPMRTKLAEREDVRSVFQGTFARFGLKNGWKGRQEQTVLLVDICDARGAPICDHLWFNLTQGIAALNLQPGESITFRARVKQYRKGYRGYREDDDLPPPATDYKLSHPTQVRRKCIFRFLNT